MIAEAWGAPKHLDGTQKHASSECKKERCYTSQVNH